MRLDLGTRFDGKLKTTAGKTFKGLVIEAAILRDRGGVADYVLKVGRRSVVNPSDVIVYNGLRYLIGRSAAEMSGAPLFQFMQMIEVTHDLPWSRWTPVRDMMTGLERESSASEEFGDLPVSLLKTGRIDDVFRVQGSRYRLVTGGAVQVNDRLGEFLVTFVEPRFGIQFAEVK
jgi:hypothetical protein